MQLRKCLLTSWLVNCVRRRSAVKFMETVCHINKQSWCRWSESVRITQFFTFWQSALKPCLYSLHYTPLLTFQPSLRAWEIQAVMWTATCLFPFPWLHLLEEIKIHPVQVITPLWLTDWCLKMEIFSAGSRFLPGHAPLWDLLPDVLTDVPFHAWLTLPPCCCAWWCLHFLQQPLLKLLPNAWFTIAPSTPTAHWLL